MVKTTLTFFLPYSASFLPALLNEGPLLSSNLEGVSNSINAFSDQISLLDIVDLPNLFGLNGVLGSVSSGFDQCANDMNDVGSLSKS
ncbi:hypothetical protein APHAL10511_006845 [Amanita phalloides]|nr:hypothetical protein APHAL10511_006845 [Amanita phalloides]